MKRLLYITNIPTPYRQKRFNLMEEIFPRYGIDFEVWYMAESEPDRKWQLPRESYRYRFRFFSGFHPTAGGMYAHINPRLIVSLARSRFDIVVIAGMASPTHWLATLFAPRKAIKIMSIESNMESTVRKSGLGATIKKFLLKRCNAYQVTGRRQIDYINYFLKSNNLCGKSAIRLPNIIDENVFQSQVNEARTRRKQLRQIYQVEEEEQMWVLPARLIPIKGIEEFLDLATGLSNIKIYILGDGPLQKKLSEQIGQNKIPAILAGHVSQDEMVKYYAAADLFVLPSIKDPSPLSPIEALAAGLPLLVSGRIGNLEDVLVEGKNGWSYDPLSDQVSAKAILQRISSMSNAELAQHGINSVEIYGRVFLSDTCVAAYAQALSNLAAS
jgi:glycosyltransferase involved in cell wall biosynthesis